MIERYSRTKFTKLWSEATRFQKMLEIEIAVAEAYHTLEIMPDDDLAVFLANAHYDLKRIKEYEQDTKHDVIAFLKAVGENMGAERKWLHFGLTSNDVVDTAQSLILQEANYIISNDIRAFIVMLRDKAIEYKNLPCIGRTHGMHAEVTSFGLKWANWYDEMKRNLERFEREARLIEVGMINGPVGNYANINPQIQELVCHDLGLRSIPISTQIISRDLHAGYISSLAMIATTIEKIAIEIRHLSRTEVNEVSEAFSAKQKGSSAMPHKKNPIASENICGVARVVRSYVNVAFENNLLWHERDISHSSSERIVLADVTTLIDYMLNRYIQTLNNLVINKAKMQENIGLSKGIIYSEKIVMELINKGIDHDTAYDMIQSYSFNKPQNIEFLDYLKETEVKEILGNEILESCFLNEHYLKNVNHIYHKLGLEVQNEK